MAHGEMAFERLLLLAAHQADEVISAERPGHRNCRLWPCRCRLRSIPDLRQTASHQSDDDFELGGRDWWDETYVATISDVSFRSLPRSRGSLMACSSRTNLTAL